MRSAEPAISVVVPTRDRPALLGECLAHLRSALSDFDELVVVDSASRDPEPVAALARANGARLERVPVAGASRARNVGWRACETNLCAFVDDDVRVAPDWADSIRSAVADPGIAFWTGRIDLPPGIERVDNPVALMDSDNARRIGLDTTGPVGHSANLVVRRDALESVGGFDELLGAGAPLRAAEDYDLFDRLAGAHLEGRYEPEIRAWHDQWRTRSELVRLEYSYGIGEGARLAKLRRTNPERARVVARRDLWQNAVLGAVSEVRGRYLFGVRCDLALLRGASVGFLRGRRLAVIDGHFRAEPKRRIRGR